MIAFLEGTLAARHEDRLTVQIGAMGLWVFVPRPLAERLTVGQPVALHTHLVVREDALTLYGFETAEARDLFILLLAGCTYSFPEIEPPGSGEADFTKVIAVGNSLTAGFANGARNGNHAGICARTGGNPEGFQALQHVRHH